MERTFKVVSKSLRGSKEQPIVALKSDNGDRLILNLDNQKQLDEYEFGQYFTIKISQEQQTLA